MITFIEKLIAQFSALWMLGVILIVAGCGNRNPMEGTNVGLEVVATDKANDKKNARNPSDIAQNGKMDSFTWELNGGTLTISGNGAIPQYASDDHVPWRPSRVSIQKVIVEEGITEIGDYAFYQCGILSSITIPKTVTGIGNKVFLGCYSLTTITILNPNLVKISYGTFDSDTHEKCSLKVLPKSVDQYKDNDIWGKFRIISLPEPEPEPEIVPETKPNPEAQPQSNVGDGKYVLIVASLNTRSEAERYGKKLQEEGFAYEIIDAGNRRYRVSIGSFDTLAEAQRQANQVRSKHDVWVARR